MNTPRFALLSTASLLLAACSPSKPLSVVQPTPAPTPVPTPHPAEGAKEAAVRSYPDLAKADSTFNKTFRELVEQQKASNPRSLTAVDWPITLAKRTGSMLGVDPVDPNAAPIVATPKPREPSALEKGAYNEKRGVSRAPVLTDRYGNRIR